MYINQFQVNEMWGKISLNWQNLHEDVNILVGINGTGKSTLLNLMYDYYTGQKVKKEIAESLSGNEIEIPITYIRSFDVPANTKKKTESMLLQNLKDVINQNNKGTSFFDYRMKMLNYPEKASEIEARIHSFFETVNSFFNESHKEIEIDKQNNTLVLKHKRTKNIQSEETIIKLEQLSSGEKQLLLILTTVFLQEEKPNVLLMDEPEISLHISWQDCLIGKIRKLNPQCQLIITTHSPNIFAEGWEDKVVFIDDLEGE